MQIHMFMLYSLISVPYKRSVMLLVAVMATRQQDVGSWQTAHALILGVDYQLPEAVRMISHEMRMLYETYTI